MTLPRQFFHVEWRAARRYDRPNDRIDRRRNYTTAESAGDQVAALRRWMDSHVELVGVWVTSGHDGEALVWAEVDPDSLPVHEDAEARYAMLDPYPHHD